MSPPFRAHVVHYSTAYGDFSKNQTIVVSETSPVILENLADSRTFPKH
jgi:hypothetical protein